MLNRYDNGIFGEDNIGERKAFTTWRFAACSPNSTLAILTGHPQNSSKIFYLCDGRVSVENAQFGREIFR